MLTQQAYHARDSQGIEVRPFVLPPRSPKLNGHVERSHGSHNEEFCEVTASSDQQPTLNRQLLGRGVYLQLRAPPSSPGLPHSVGS